MNETKLKKIADFLKDSIAEMYEYANSDEYDDLEQHDCCIAAEAYEFVLRYVKKLMNENTEG
jgi:hypothetical protein